MLGRPSEQIPVRVETPLPRVGESRFAVRPKCSPPVQGRLEGGGREYSRYLQIQFPVGGRETHLSDAAGMYSTTTAAPRRVWRGAGSVGRGRVRGPSQPARVCAAAPVALHRGPLAFDGSGLPRPAQAVSARKRPSAASLRMRNDEIECETGYLIDE